MTGELLAPLYLPILIQPYQFAGYCRVLPAVVQQENHSPAKMGNGIDMMVLSAVSQRERYLAVDQRSVEGKAQDYLAGGID